MDLSTITIQNFKDRFYRDFTFKTTEMGAIALQADPDFVQDRDITNAFMDAQELLNQGLFPDNNGITIGYLLLTAHCLCLNINNANAGLGATAGMPVTARSVGSVSESYSIPENYLKNPQLQPYLGTAYGLKYLTMVLPAITGNVASVYARTHP